MIPTDICNLQSLGKELDRDRRARAGYSEPGDSSGSDVAGHCPESMRLRSLERSPSTSPNDGQIEERSFATCLICLTRPPTAVLLPCCHLNLCHICAPMVIIRQRASSSTMSSLSEYVPAGRSSARPSFEQTKWNQMLLRATASHPKSRRLSAGGYVAPEIGTCGAEIAPRSLLPTTVESGPVLEDNSDAAKITGRIGVGGRIALSGGRAVDEGDAKCIMCRSGIEGWLRVYPG